MRAHDDAKDEIDGFLARLKRSLDPSSRSYQMVQNRELFSAIRDELAQVLAAGFTMKSTWQLLRDEGRRAMSYATFCSHCRASGLKRVTLESLARPQVGDDGTDDDDQTGWLH